MMNDYAVQKYLLQGVALAWPPDATPADLPDQIVKVTRTLGLTLNAVTTQGRFIAKQIEHISAVKHTLIVGKPNKCGEETISTVTGKAIDEIFKEEVRAAQLRCELPMDLRVVAGNGRGPDLVWGCTAWELTTAEQARTKVRRDVDGQEMVYDFYFILSY